MASIERRSGKRGDSFVVRYRDEQRRQRSKSFSAHIDAVRFSNKVEVQLAEGEWIDPQRGRERFADFHARWVEARTVSPSREATEASHARVHILPRWGNVPLGRIRPLDVDAWVKDLRSEVRVQRDPKSPAPVSYKPASAVTKEMVLLQFKMCLDAAVREGILRMNPATNTRAPARHRKRVTQADVLDSHELTELVSNTPDQWKALVYLSGWLGWRWSEAMGLRMRDVDLEAGVIYVGNQVVVESRGVLHVRDTGKTDAATRTIPLPQPAQDVLRWHIERRSDVEGPDGRVFVTARGETPFRSNFRRVFQKAVNDAGLGGRGISMRQLRHTAASLMLTHGLDILDVQERLGHARGSVTLDIYGRVLAGRRVSGTERLTHVMQAYSDTSWLTSAATVAG